MRRLIASLWFATHNAGQNFRRNLGVSLAGVFTMGLILFLVGGALLFTHSVDTVLEHQQVNASKIKIYLSDSASLASITNFEGRLQRDPRVTSVAFENKDQAKSEASTDPNIANALKALQGDNPLPASLNLGVKRLTDLASIDSMAKKTPIVDKTTATDYNPDVIGKLHTLINIIEVVGGVIALILLIVSVVIIMNTIRTAVYARRTEIEIMKLVGATDWFVRWPFILEGVLGGIMAAVFSGAIVAGGYELFVSYTHSSLFGVPFDTPYTLTLLMILGIGGVVVGAFGSYLGVRRFLTV